MVLEKNLHELELELGYVIRIHEHPNWDTTTTLVEVVTRPCNPNPSFVHVDVHQSCVESS